MKEIIREFYSLGIFVIPLNHKDGKFIHPSYSHKFDTGFTLEDALALCDAGYDKGVAIMHGKCNMHLCCLDFDEKNAPGQNLWEKYRHICDPDVLRKILVESTRSDGKHGWFLCKTLPPHKALASSVTGQEWIACRSAVNNGITYCAPSPGYTLLNGSFDDLQELTESEMMHVIDAAMQLNQWEGHKSKKGNNLPMIRPPADLLPYFREFDKKIPVEWVMELLEKEGWTTDGNIKRKKYDDQTWEFMRYWRPEKDQREPASANLWLQTKRLSVFTTSTVLPAFGGYEHFSHLPSTLLYHFSDRDWKAAYAQICETAQEQRIELPQAIPMAYSVISNNREVWRVDVKGIIDWATRAGYQWKRMSYGMYWALNKMVQRGTRARYEMGYHVTFCQWFSNREAAFILPRLQGAERTNRGYEFSAWFDGAPVTVIYRTGMLNGNIRVDVEWIDRDMQEQVRIEEEATNALRSEISKYIFSSLRSNVSEEEIQATVIERYGIADMDKFLLNSNYPITKKQMA